MGKPSAGIVTVSQKVGGDAADHACVGAVAGDPRVIDGPGEYEIADVLINGVRTWPDGAGTGDDGGSVRISTMFVIDVDELRICHLGDLGQRLTADQVESLGSINILMVPVGGGETIGPNLATEVVSQVEPNIVVPMHYRIEGTQADKLEPVDRFVREMGAESITPIPKLSLNAKSSLPSDIQLLVMDHKKA